MCKTMSLKVWNCRRYALVKRLLVKALHNRSRHVLKWGETNHWILQCASFYQCFKNICHKMCWLLGMFYSSLFSIKGNSVHWEILSCVVFACVHVCCHRASGGNWEPKSQWSPRLWTTWKSFCLGCPGTRRLLSRGVHTHTHTQVSAYRMPQE